MKKKFLCIILSLCMILPAFSGLSAYATGVEAIETNPNDPADPMSQVPAENAYEKIHFYFDTAEYANLENATELATATASV